MTWLTPTSGLTRPPMPTWPTTSRGLPMIGSSPRWRCWTGTDQLTWTNLKPRFQRQFATQTDKKMIMEGLYNLAMKPGESTGELLARITNTMVMIKESYASYENLIQRPRHITMSTMDLPCLCADNGEMRPWTTPSSSWRCNCSGQPWCPNYRWSWNKGIATP